MKRNLVVVVGFAIALQAASGRSQDAPRYNKQRVTFKSGELTLVGYLFKPEGSGPYPAIV
jgi:hypothetical protein